MKYIVCCECGNVPSFSVDSYKLHYKGQEVPDVVVGKDRIRHLANEYLESHFQDYLMGIVGVRDRFSYYFEVSESGDILECRNLISGERVA